MNRSHDSPLYSLHERKTLDLRSGFDVSPQQNRQRSPPPACSHYNASILPLFRSRELFVEEGSAFHIIKTNLSLGLLSERQTSEIYLSQFPEDFAPPTKYRCLTYHCRTHRIQCAECPSCSIKHSVALSLHCSPRYHLCDTSYIRFRL